jgi:hypothetical protein
MKGVRFVVNEREEKVAVQIDLKVLSRKQEAVEEFLRAVLTGELKTRKETVLGDQQIKADEAYTKSQQP